MECECFVWIRGCWMDIDRGCLEVDEGAMGDEVGGTVGLWVDFCECHDEGILLAEHAYDVGCDFMVSSRSP